MSLTGLRVNVETLGGSPFMALRLEILDRRMRLQRRALSGEEVQLAPGVYVVSVACPDGTRAVRGAEVKPGVMTVVPIEWRPARFGGMEARAGIEGAKAIGRRPPQGFAQRFVEFRAEEGAFVPLIEPSAMDVTDYQFDRGVLEVSMTLRLDNGPNQLPFVQLAASGQLITVALPLAPGTDATKCLLSVMVSAAKLDANVQLGGSPEADLVAQFVAGGELRQVADLPEFAEKMLFRKMSHPLGAAIGGYALLRLGALDRLHDWPRNLSERFPWLPDGPVILGEQALRNGLPEEALKCFTESVRRGLPVFTDGYSMLLARLRDFARGTGVAGLTPAIKEQAADALRRIARWAPFVDFGELLLTLRPADPVNQTNALQTTRAEKWKLFRVPLGRATSSEDYWTDPNE